MRILTGVPLGRASNDKRVAATTIFGDFGGYFFGNVRNKTINRAYSMAIGLCYPLTACN